MPTSKRCYNSKHKLHNKIKPKNTNRRTRRGGASKVIPFKRYPYTCGTTPRSEAICTITKESQMQNNRNHSHGGSKKSDAHQQIVVPKFDDNHIISPYNHNNASKHNNIIYTQSKANSKYDYYAFKKPAQTGGVRSNIKRRSNIKKHKIQTRRKCVKKQSKYTKSRRHNKGGKIEKSVYSDFLTWYDAFPNLYNTSLTGGSNPISRNRGWPCNS